MSNFFAEQLIRQNAVAQELKGFLDERAFVLGIQAPERVALAYDGMGTSVDYVVLAELIRLARIGLEIDARLAIPVMPEVIL